jgi:hypothetical protein
MRHTYRYQPQIRAIWIGELQATLGINTTTHSSILLLPLPLLLLLPLLLPLLLLLLLLLTYDTKEIVIGQAVLEVAILERVAIA